SAVTAPLRVIFIVSLPELGGNPQEDDTPMTSKTQAPTVAQITYTKSVLIHRPVTTLAKTATTDVQTPRFRPNDRLLAFLKTL
ncbi:hypothetical protein, partial [Caballeronia sordidicola]